MKNGFLVVNEKDWQGLEPERRDWLIFNTLQSMDARLKVLERWNKALSLTGGLIGGALAGLGVKLL
ncbi:MAG: hypothetical protein WC455_29910 [Dehalococcoidia bacterium]|jgi:hypothetical protein